MRTRTEFPRRVRERENVWIPLSDGAKLAARIWLPEDAEADPVPALLEYIPYRKSDWTARRDSVRHPYLAGHGYAAVRVDMRGSGDSDGTLLDEYTEKEQDDAVDVIAWLAAQPWCTGGIGMFGISWGGFNALQVAARRPPELGAILTLCSTDDRYADDVHYVGGCLLAIDMLPWAASMLAWNATPPHPSVVGGGWRDQWLDRLDRTPFFAESWISHQRRDAYWKHGSVCEDYGAIECPVYAVGGWADGYSNAIFRLLAGLPGPRKGLIGPWAHGFPEEGVPGPAIGFLQESLRWWDHWLKGIDTGVMDEPMLRVWMEEPVPPRPHYEERPGRWVAEPAWPREALEPRELLLTDTPSEIDGVQTNGLDSGLWCPYGDALDLPPDQRRDDGLSLSFTSDPLREPFEILGFPEVSLSLSVDRPRAFVAVRLCEVAPSGASTLVTRGVLNLTHRDSHEDPEPLAPGRRYEVRVPLNALAHRFERGYRIRVAVSPTYWPWVWPSPEPVRLTLFRGSLLLPVREPRAGDEELPPFDEPELAPELALERLSDEFARRTVEFDVASGEAILTYSYGDGRRRLPNGVELDDEAKQTFRLAEGDPLSASVHVGERIEIARDGWRVRVETESEMTADAEAFHLENTVVAYEGDERFWERTRRVSAPRDLV
ncbi:MAG: CocE/NonD family hydrolase [Actinomycetota bacterium]|nr:CocE/NonD family hydrolase [Actinomycetota bacterium]